MFRALFGNVKTGRLLRLPYLGYSLLIGVLVVVLLMVFFMSLVGAGATEHLMEGNFQEIQQELRERLGFAMIAVSVLVGIFFSFAGCNIMAKRIRDMGLPGWWTVLLIIVVPAVLSGVISMVVSNALHAILWLALLLIPSNAFGKGG